MKNYIHYKGVLLQPNLINYIKHMDLVDEYREELVALSKSWDNLSLLSHFVNNTTNINETKQNFSKLTNTLLNRLAHELLQKTVRQIGFKAQISIDILIRNLFERTADIGFLATDNDIREFIKNNPTRYEQSFKENAKILRDRFCEYTQKYSVYYDIVLFDTSGKVLVKLDNDSFVDKSDDSIIHQALATNEYIESFKYHDFIPNKKKSLVYASKVTVSNENDEAIGVLALCFRFQDEMQGIFDNLCNTKNKECLMILDKDAKVIASSDHYHIALGSQLSFNLQNDHSLITHGGRDYIVKSCKTNGYQGYMGQEWYGHIMVPIESAFIPEDDDLNIDKNILLAILQEGQEFSEDLKSIPIEANNIQTNLNRLVWNGNIKRSANNAVDMVKNFSRALLNELSTTGEKTKKIFDLSIANLTKTIILNNATYVSSLMIDIMDRNLYERANDCRWWALTQDFRSILNQNELNIKNNPKLAQILCYINNLYTVYTNIFIYDADGIIVAVSNESQRDVIGMKLDESTLYKIKQIENSNDYSVSSFERTRLYNDDFTYTFYAKITNDKEKFIGGIGVVFDSSVEFQCMLKESIPNFSDSIDEKRFGVFTNKEGMIIASTKDDLKTGDCLDIDKKFFTLLNGESKSEIVIYNGNYYAIGVTCSKGYREYKVKDRYKNDIYAIFFSYISSSDLKITQSKEIFKENNNPISNNTQEIASFYIGKKWLGVEIEKVIEVISIEKLDLAPTLNNDHYFKGTIIYDNKAVGVIDIKGFLDENVNEKYTEVVIIKHFDNVSENYIGILINQLGDIPEIKKEKIKKLESYLVGKSTLINSIVVPEEKSNDESILSILDMGLLKTQLIDKQMHGMNGN